MACGKVLVAALVFFLQFFPLLVPVEAINTTSLPLTNTTEAKVGCIESEREALLRFKQSLTDPSNRLASWIGKECCIWKGVYCDIQTGNVIRLDLKDASGNCYQKKMGYLISGNWSCLGGNISPALLDLQHLVYLDLGGNDFQGLATPNFLGSLLKLQYLNLSHSSLVGIPPSFGNLSRLQYLSLRSYSYPYDIVESSWVKDLNWVSSMSSLKYIDLSHVNLSLATHWLESFNKLPSLVELRLQNSSLHYLPYSFPNWNMTNLSILSLSLNNFVDSVLPKWLSNATTLEILDIGLSNIEGPISNVEWGKLCNLRGLYLTEDKINGDISGVVEGLSSCSNATIEVLGLAGNRLTGQFPNSLGHLKNLRMISISFNQISGTIPTSIEQLSSLEILDLGQNRLKGVLPESIFNFTELTQLFLATNDWEGNLSQNDFARLHKLKFLAISCGERFAVNLSSEWIPPFSLTYIELRKCSLGPKLPTWLSTQKQLRTIILSNDSISDPIPPWLWTMCSQLQLLDLSENGIGGNLPRLVNFPSFQSRLVDFYSSYNDGVVVDLSSNSIRGLLPLWPNVTHLNLANNLFSGSIPINIGHVMTKLQVIDLSGNTFTGSIPYSITRVKQLMRLDLSDNHLSGKIPDWWDDLQQLHVIDLSGNNLSGGIPPSLCSPPSLFWLRLSRNNLFGELPKSLSNCKSLLTLDIGENKINGTIPEWFGESLLSLQKLSMTDNMIGGSIPTQLCQLFGLQILDLSHNNLTGPIPSCLGSWRALKSVKFYKWHPNYYHFSYVFTPKMELVKKGTRMTYTFTIDQVNLIDLSFNNLHGEIPNEITGLSALGTLNISWNQLSGRIPEDIGSMQQLETLDLSSNHLSGSIPLSMVSITTLSYLNLSYNNLGGPIPSTNQFGTFTNPSSFEGNPELCGKPLITDCSRPRKREMNKKIEEDDDDDDERYSPSFGNISSLRYLDLYAYSYPYDTVERSWIKDLNWVSGLSSLKYLDLSFVVLSLATNWLEAFNKLPSLVTLRLQNSSLHYLPYSLPNWNITSLSYLSLSQNNFVNSVLPKWLSNATTIETLYIRYSNIEGPISNVEWGKLCNLLELYLMHNKINGDVSRVVEGLSSCSNTTIEVLRLGENALTGKLPNSLGHLKNLRILTISINPISGTVSTSIERLLQLETLQLGENQLKGALPLSIFNFSELTELCLATNALEGNLSQNHFARLHRLKLLSYLVEKDIGAYLPGLVNFPSISSWTVLDFYFSYYYGVVVDLSSNHFHGLLPLWPNVLDLSGNAFTGPIPFSITRAKQLLRLDLSENYLSGKIPYWWCYLQLLQVIDLSGNNLSGSIPPSICSPPSLFWLRLSGNNLSGELPKSLINCKSLLTLDIGENKINGTIPEWFGKRLLSLQKLRMTGSIPSCLGSLRDQVHGILQVVSQLRLFRLCLSALGTLNLAWNQVSVRIPDDIGSMKLLETLDLSSNNLSAYQFGTFTDPSNFEAELNETLQRRLKILHLCTSSIELLQGSYRLGIITSSCRPAVSDFWKALREEEMDPISTLWRPTVLFLQSTNS
ncbi:hypothetical protein RND71_041099 [Anisodus tanguticus]|uniref:Leucine-rich repeat-containing N-terminal plant-type domain-containing protein n=1 Tax=Anisodus tanguticus TaxID=243964 RepID=A0AAE1UQV2_9SOLA|nr:hypothetical protein RND71_041099 [Anisodus tanguticus]